MHTRTLGRKRDAREALLRNLVTNAVLFEKLVTTKARAKETRAWIDRLIVTAKPRDLNARRRLQAFFFHPNAVHKVLEDLVLRYKSRTGGFTQWIPLGRRKGDGAEMVMLKLVPGDRAPKTEEPKTEKKKEARGKKQVRSARRTGGK